MRTGPRKTSSVCKGNRIPFWVVCSVEAGTCISVFIQKLMLRPAAEVLILHQAQRRLDHGVLKPQQPITFSPKPYICILPRGHMHAYACQPVDYVSKLWQHRSATLLATITQTEAWGVGILYIAKKMMAREQIDVSDGRDCEHF